MDCWQQRHTRPGATMFTDVLPAVVYHSLGGKSADIWPITGSWLLHLLAARIFDDMQDGEGLARPWMQRGPALALPLGIGILGAASLCLTYLADQGDTFRDILQVLSQTKMQASRAQAREPLRDLSEMALEAYFEHIIATTGEVFAAGAWMGGRLYGADESILRALNAFGYNYGLQVAILDDCQDVQAIDGQGDSDLVKGHFRLPLLYAVAQTEHPAQPCLLNLLQNPLSSTQAMEVVGLLEEMAAIDWSLRAAAVFREKAILALSGIPEPAQSELLAYV
jgi:geranylgeranyl pyrophosphate synthase